MLYCIEIVAKITMTGYTDAMTLNHAFPSTVQRISSLSIDILSTCNIGPTILLERDVEESNYYVNFVLYLAEPFCNLLMFNRLDRSIYLLNYLPIPPFTTASSTFIEGGALFCHEPMFTFFTKAGPMVFHGENCYRIFRNDTIER